MRLTEYKNAEEKEKGFFDPKNRYEAKQEDFFKIPGAPIAYWVSENFLNNFKNSKKIEDFLEITGSHNKTANNEKYIKFLWEISLKKMLNKWVYYAKGGEYRKWFGNIDYVVDWSKEAREFYETNPTSNLLDQKYWFKEGITYTDLTTKGFNCRYIDNKSIADMSGPALYTSNKLYRNLIMSLLNTKIANKIFQLLNPTFHIKINDIKRFPIIFPKSPEIKQKIDKLTQECIDISKEEWDNRETSWDFTTNELIRLKTDSGKIEDAYHRYCEYWREKFYKLHKNEEELNRLFIEIYELQDEITPDVPLEDITILKKEAKIVDGELVFDKKEIIKQFISYAVGVMFGRYSLDHEGLHIADMGVGIEEANTKFGIKEPTFAIDEDNIIPVLEDNFFEDDIVQKFKEFLKVSFGEQHFEENLRFIEDALGKSIRKYFVKDFYEDHIKRYKKRPIYWMISSPNKSFQALLYMHKYQSDIFARAQTLYLHEYITKLESLIARNQEILNSDSTSTSQKRAAQKEIERAKKIIDELIEFDREKFDHFAKNSIAIDLDDGVKVNYCKFRDILYPIKGLCK